MRSTAVETTSTRQSRSPAIDSHQDDGRRTTGSGITASARNAEYGVPGAGGKQAVRNCRISELSRRTATQYTIDPDGSGPAASFTLRNPDFSRQSLRGNAVFRWEDRPGSVLYVASTQSRAADGALGNLDLARDRTALLAARPDNILLVKASWWLPRWPGRGARERRTP
jgi:hypothetical protein